MASFLIICLKFQNETKLDEKSKPKKKKIRNSIFNSRVFRKYRTNNFFPKVTPKHLENSIDQLMRSTLHNNLVFVEKNLRTYSISEPYRKQISPLIFRTSGYQIQIDLRSQYQGIYCQYKCLKIRLKSKNDIQQLKIWFREFSDKLFLSRLVLLKSKANS